MKALYELLAKVGTNPKLRAWAMEQIINLKKLKPNYKKDPTGKKSWDYQDDLNKVKDIKNPNWRREKIAKERAYDLKTKVVDIAKAKDKVRWDKVDKQRDKDKFYGVTGQVDTFLKKMGKDTDEFFKKHELDQKWLNKMIKAKKAGDPRAIKILDDHFKKMDKDFADKIIPFKPKKAEGGRIGLDEGGPSQKEIDKGIAAIEKLKSSLMPESYEELIEIYKDKQKDLNIDIMEDAGGLGEMLGEGGRIGMMYGGDPGFAFSYGGSWADWKDNHASEMPLMDYINQKLPKARNPFSDSSYQDGGPVIDKDKYDKALRAGKSPAQAYEEATKDPLEALDLKAQFDEIFKKAEGGRIGMQLGGDLRTRGIMQALKILRDIGYTTSKGKIFPWPGGDLYPKGVINKYLSKGVEKGMLLKKQLENDIKGYKDLINNYKKDYSKYELDDFKETINTIKNDIKSVDKYILKSQSKKATKHAEGGRIGMAKGDTPSESWMRDYYFDGKGNYDTWMTFDQFKLGPGKELWLNRKAKGGRVGFKKGGKGGIGDLMSEMYRLFEIAPLLASPELMDLIQKVPFEKGGRAEFKKGGGPNMSRRSFLQLMGGLASLPVVGKYFKLGKPVTDFGVKLKTKFHNSDVDYGTSGFAYFDLSSLTGPVKLAASNIIKKLKIKDLKNVEPGDTKLVLKELEKKGIKGKLTGIVDEGGDVLKQAEKAGQKNFVQTYKKQSMKQNVKDHKQYNDYVVYENDPGFRNWNAATKGKLDKPFVSTIDEVAEMLEPVVKKAEGGSVGYPPIQLGPLDLTPRASGGFSQGQPYGPNLRQKTWSDNIGIGGVLDLPGGFNLTGEYDKYRTKDRLYTADDEYLDKRVRDDHDRWKLGLQWKKKFAKGGKAWRPKSAPQLTTTIPPESGPMPQGLTYLTGDDIVQNIGHKHGRN